MTTAAAPKRIQRERTPGWRKPPGAVYVGRPTRYRNPFRIGAELEFPYSEILGGGPVRDRAHAVELFTAYARITPFYHEFIRDQLAGRDLMCWCPPGEPCHADVLIEIANTPETP